MVIAGCAALLIAFLATLAVYWYFGRTGRKQSEDEIIGGRILSESPKDVARMMKKRGEASDIRIDDLPLKLDSEIQNFAMHGTVGSGKFQLMSKILKQLRERGDLVIIYDKDCTVLPYVKTLSRWGLRWWRQAKTDSGNERCPSRCFSSRSPAIREAAGPDASAKSLDVVALDTRQEKAWADPELLKADWRRRLTDKKFDIDNYINQAQTRAEPAAPVVGGTEGIRSTGQPDTAS